MVRWHLRSNRTPAGAKVKRNSKKKRFQRGSEFLEARIHKKKNKLSRTLGGGVKVKVLSLDSGISWLTIPARCAIFCAKPSIHRVFARIDDDRDKGRPHQQRPSEDSI